MGIPEVAWQCSRCGRVEATLPETSKTVDPRWRLARCPNSVCPSRQEEKPEQTVIFKAVKFPSES